MVSSINTIDYNNTLNLLNSTFGFLGPSSGTNTNFLDFSNAIAYNDAINSSAESDSFINSEQSLLQQNGSSTYSPLSAGVLSNPSQLNPNPDTINSMLQSSLGTPFSLADIGDIPASADYVGQMMSSNFVNMLGMPQIESSPISSIYSLLGSPNYNNGQWVSSGTLIDVQV